jgi:type I restriction enzyme S subunit
MEATLTKKMNINKTNWTLVKFGDVVYEPKETMKDIVAEGIEHVVGLEHITTDDIHLRNSEGIEESTTFTKKFAKGDVLFGRRRAYLRKAAQAPFGGICSGDITVFRTKKELLPELLPFIVNNEKFFDYAIKHSAGGLSPRVKFKDLADYEFLLPPKDQQAQLAELFWAMDEVIEKEKKLLDVLNYNKLSYEKTVFFINRPGIEKKIPSGYEILKLEEIAEITGGSTPSRDRNEFWNGDIPWLTPTDVTNHNKINLIKTKECITDLGLKNISNRLYPPGSILFCTRATIGYAIINDVPMTTNQGFSNFIVNDRTSNYFLYFLLKYLTPELTRLAGGSTFLEISKSSIRKFKVIIPPIHIQKKIEKVLLDFETNRLIILNKLQSSQSLQKSLINQVF